MNREATDDADVLVVGYGPVGQVTAILLAQRGWRVTVVERWPEPYLMPRATSFDGESARILAAAGIGDDMAGIGEPTGDYSWHNGAGELLFHVEVADQGYSGWPDSTSMYSPALESALTTRAAALANLVVLRGHRAVALADRGDQVELTVTGPGDRDRVLRGRWLVACDGANSLVRQRGGFTTTDLGFRNDWLTCDVVPHDGREFRPNNLQICDPARPRSAISAGPGHRRWEFMRLPGESMEEFGRLENAWRLLALFDIDEGNATLIRHAVYTFQARYVDRWRLGRLLLAGDAAHLMPPFAGQGLCSGLRDAANLAWKLDLVLRGEAADRILDSYGAERRPLVEQAIAISMNLGRVIGQTDPAAARDRDQVMIAARQRGVGSARPTSAVQPLTDGLLHRDARGVPVLPAGALTPQARLARGTEVRLFDELVGSGFAVVATRPPAELLDADRLSFLEGVGARLVHVVSADTTDTLDTPEYAAGPGLVDVDDVYVPFLARTGAVAMVTRPDFYLFGAAADGAGLVAVIDDLRWQLRAAVLTG
jgi:flavoprotein hydroxylase